MNLLLTNDDGIFAPGLMALKNRLDRDHRVHIVAPESEQSAVGHAITLADPIKVKEIKKNGAFHGYAVSGTPADCVRIGVSELLDRPPDAVISGVNRGANVGINILYSGTVSAATEAAILGLPAAAVSLDQYSEPDFTHAVEVAARLVPQLKQWCDAPGLCLNVNVPGLDPADIKEPVVVHQCLQTADETFDRRVDPRDNLYYWRGKEIPPRQPDPDSDLVALSRGHITITPLRFDLTFHREMAGLRRSVALFKT
jgi:5'-nucleotidase